MEEPVPFPREVPLSELPLQPAAAPRIGLAEALRRRWPIAVIVAILGAAVGLTLGLTRSPTYTAESRLAVGRLDITAPGAVSTFAEATRALTTQYSRMVKAEPVVTRVGRRLRISPVEVANSVTAAPIPESPIFRVEAESSSERRAVAMAGATSRALADYTTRLNRRNPDSRRLFRRFRRAQLVLARRTDQQRRLRRAVGFNPDNARDRDAMARAVTRTEAAKLEMLTIRGAYQASRQNQAATSLVQVVTRPVDASSDRSSALQLYVFVGLVVGTVLGLALALAAAQREARRAILR